MTISRRGFIAALLSVLAVTWQPAAAESYAEHRFQGQNVFDRLMAKATAENWRKLPMSELLGKIAMEFQGTPYEANTLEISPGHEICSVNLQALDCVTFYETTLDFARMLKKGGSKPEDLLNEVIYTRYRGGVARAYHTRLHYTSEWVLDNEGKHVVEILSKLPGSQPFHPDVNYMSTHASSNPQLVKHSDSIAKIARFERSLNRKTLSFVPMNMIKAAEPLLKTGDIVAICTSEPGLDVTHTGIVYRTPDGVAHFMDASSRKGIMKVLLEPGPINHTLERFKTATGVIFARPLEP